MTRNYTNIWGTPIVDKKVIEGIEKAIEQKKHLDKNKKYTCDPFVGFIEKKEA